MLKKQFTMCCKITLGFGNNFHYTVVKLQQLQKVTAEFFYSESFLSHT